jgi:hypothetical protein
MRSRLRGKLFFTTHTHKSLAPNRAVPLKSRNRRFNCPDGANARAAISRWEREMINSGLIAGAECGVVIWLSRGQKSASHHLFAPLWIICKILFLSTVLCASLVSFECVHTQRSRALETRGSRFLNLFGRLFNLISNKGQQHLKLAGVLMLW